MPDPLARSLDDPVWIGQVDPVGELEIDPRRVGDDREQQPSHPHGPAEGDELVAEVDLLDGIRDLTSDRCAKGPLDRLELGGVPGEETIDVCLEIGPGRHVLGR